MDRYHQIVLGFDGSSCAEKAAREAMRIAGWSVAPLWSYRVIPRTEVSDLIASTRLSERDSLCSFVRQDDAILDTIGNPFFETEWHHCCVLGNPVTMLLNKAGEHNADLIVLGTHGHTHEKAGVLGPVAREVIRDASCDVLVVREIIVGTFCNTALVLGEGTNEADAAALRRAAAIATHGGCSLQVVSCYSSGWQRLLPGASSPKAAKTQVANGVQTRRNSLQKLIDSEPIPAGTPETSLRVLAHHSPTLGLLEELQKIKADLIVLPAYLSNSAPDVERLVASTGSSVLLTSHPDPGSASSPSEVPEENPTPIDAESCSSSPARER